MMVTTATHGVYQEGQPPPPPPGGGWDKEPPLYTSNTVLWDGHRVLLSRAGGAFGVGTWGELVPCILPHGLDFDTAITTGTWHFSILGAQKLVLRTSQDPCFSHLLQGGGLGSALIL